MNACPVGHIPSGLKRRRSLSPTPQGSVCSPIIFNVMINDIFSQLGAGVEKSLFADDGAMWKRGRNVLSVVKSMQSAINEVKKWTDMWGFWLSVSKTQVICFSKERQCHSIKLQLSQTFRTGWILNWHLELIYKRLLINTKKFSIF